ncbi:distal tail protein Dit [Nesterenkonia lacusekhoensis]|uniref:Phage tail component-like protein n=1 Tax=Nesterenkonia lacusekhoensis TaxID=150832 RepID=A0ABS4SYW4_9MICC|nr:putative phage tail component-like protein [Nesterenkonia lacusekhoensis]
MTAGEGVAVRDIDIRFNGNSVNEVLEDEGFRFGVRNIEGEGLIARDPHTVDLPGDGSRWVDTRVGPRQITIEYQAQAGKSPGHDAMEEQARLEEVLQGVLFSDAPRPLRFSHQHGLFRGTLQALGKTQNHAHMHVGTMTFLCPDPFRYGDQETLEPDAEGVVNVLTNYYVEPVLTWETTEAVGSAWVAVDGRRLTIDTAVSAGQQIRVDARRMETRVGGVLNVEDVRGRYPRLRPGSVLTTNTGGTISVSYERRWL